jgi:hypothetical protein
VYDAAGAHTVFLLWPGFVHPVIYCIISAVEMPQSRFVCLGARITEWLCSLGYGLYN